MRDIFIAHTPFLLEEFPFNEMLWNHKDRTPLRTKIFQEALGSLGRVARLNLTLWLLVTEHSTDEVLDSIRERLKPHITLESMGDIFVIEASNYEGTSSQETVSAMQAICNVKSVPLSPTVAVGTGSAAVSKSKPVHQTAEQSRREKLAAEYGIKPTDAMFRRMPGSFESGRR